MSVATPPSHTLTPEVGPTLDTLRTALALQRHQEWVSGPVEAIPGALAGVGFSLVGAVVQPDYTGGRAYVAVRGPQAVVAFRGSGGDSVDQTMLNVLADAKVRRVVPFELAGKDASVKVHQGFYETWLAFRHELAQRLRALTAPEVYVTGFSMGSALATLCALDVALQGRAKVTFHGAGTPRVGNRAFGDRMAQQVPQALRTVLNSDPVARVPLQTTTNRRFRHVGALLELDADGAPVPLEQITGRLMDCPAIKDHDRERYRHMLERIIERFSANPRVLHERWGEDPLTRAAVVERHEAGGESVYDADDGD